MHKNKEHLFANAKIGHEESRHSQSDQVQVT